METRHKDFRAPSFIQYEGPKNDAPKKNATQKKRKRGEEEPMNDTMEMPKSRTRTSKSAKMEKAPLITQDTISTKDKPKPKNKAAKESKSIVAWVAVTEGSLDPGAMSVYFGKDDPRNVVELIKDGGKLDGLEHAYVLGAIRAIELCGDNKSSLKIFTNCRNLVQSDMDSQLQTKMDKHKGNVTVQFTGRRSHADRDAAMKLAQEYLESHQANLAKDDHIVDSLKVGDNVAVQRSDSGYQDVATAKPSKAKAATKRKTARTTAKRTTPYNKKEPEAKVEKPSAPTTKKPAKKSQKVPEVKVEEAQATPAPRPARRQKAAVTKGSSETTTVVTPSKANHKQGTSSRAKRAPKTAASVSGGQHAGQGQEDQDNSIGASLIAGLSNLFGWFSTSLGR